MEDALGEKEKLAASFKQQVDVLEQRFKSLENDSKIKIGALEKELQESNSRNRELQEASEQAKTLQQQLQAVKEKTSNLEHCISEKQFTIDKIGKELEVAKNNLETKDRTTEDLKKQLSDERNEVQKKADQLKHLQLDVERMNKTLADQQVLLKQLEGSVADATFKYQEKESKSKFLEEELSNRDTTLQKVNRDLDEARRSLENQSAESKKRLAEECSKSNNFQERVENMQIEVAEFKREVSSQKEELMKKEKELQAVKSDLQSKFNEIRDVEKKLSSTTELCKENEEKTKNVLAEKMALEKELAEAKRNLGVQRGEAQKNLEGEISKSRNLKNEVQKMEAEVDKAKSRISELKDELSRTESELNLARTDVQSKKNNIQNLEKKATKLCEEKEAESKVAGEKLELLEKELLEAKRNAETQDAKMKLLMEKMQAEIKELQNQIQLQIEELAKKDNDLQTSRREVQSKLSDISELEQKTLEMTQLGNEMENRIKAGSAETIALREELNEAKKTLETQGEGFARMEVEITKSRDLKKQLKKEIEERGDKLTAVEKDCESVRTELESKTAELVTLKIQLEDLQTESADTIKGLKEELNGKISEMEQVVLVMTAMDRTLLELRQKCNELGERQKATDSRSAETREKLELEKARNLQLKDDFESMESERKASIESLSQSLRELNEHMADLENNMHNSQLEVQEIVEKLAAAKSEVQAKNVEINVLKIQIEDLLAESATTKQEVEAKNAEMNVLKIQLEDLLTESATTKQEGEAKNAEINVFKIQLEDLLTESATTKQEVEAKNAEINVFKIQLEVLLTESSTTIEELKQDLSDKNLELASTRKQVEVTTEESSQSVQKLAEIAAELESVQGLNSDLQREKGKLEDLLRKEKDTAIELRTKVNGLEEAEESKMKLQSELDSLSVKLSEKEDLQSKYEALTKEKDNWALSIEEEHAKSDLLRKELTSKNLEVKELEERCTSLDNSLTELCTTTKEKDVELGLAKEEVRSLKVYSEVANGEAVRFESQEWKLRCEELTFLKEELDNALAVESECSKQLRDKVDILEKERNILRSDEESIKNKLADLKTRCDELRNEKEQLALQLDSEKKLSLEMELKNENLDKELKAKHQQDDTLQQKYDEVLIINDSLKSQSQKALISEEKVEDLRKELKELQQSCVQRKKLELELEKVLESKEFEASKYNQLLEENEVLKSKICRLEEEMQDSLCVGKSSRDRVEQLQHSIQREKEQNLNLINQLTNVKQSIAEIENQGDRLIAENDALTKELTEKRLLVKTMIRTELSLKQQLDADRSFAAKLQQDSDALATELVEKRKTIKVMLEVEEDLRIRLNSEKGVVAKMQNELDVARQNNRINEEKITSYVNMLEQLDRELAESRICKSCERLSGRELELKGLLEEEKNVSESLRKDLESRKEEDHDRSWQSPVDSVLSIKSELETCHHVLAVELESSKSEIVQLNARISEASENRHHKEEELQKAREEAKCNLDRLAGIASYLSLIVDRHCKSWDRERRESSAGDPCMTMLHRLDAELGHRTEVPIRTPEDAAEVAPNCLNAMDDLMRELESTLTKNTKQLCLLRGQIQSTRETIEGSQIDDDGGKMGENGDCVSVVASPVSSVQMLEREFSTLHALLARLKNFQHAQR